MMIGDGLTRYAEQHAGVYPASLGDLVPDYIEQETAASLICPEDKSAFPSPDTSYKYLASGERVSDERMVPVVMDRQPLHSDGRFNVLFSNGRVTLMSPEHVERLFVGTSTERAEESPTGAESGGNGL